MSRRKSRAARSMPSGVWSTCRLKIVHAHGSRAQASTLSSSRSMSRTVP
jgi:hypothetical protein